MTNIAEKVNVLLDTDFIIRTCLFQNIVSLRALARHIIKSKNLQQSNLDAVISAIRRYKREHQHKQTKKENSFKNVDIKTKDNVIDVYVPKTKEMQNKVSKLNSEIDYDKGEILRVIQADQGIRLIIDEKNLKYIDSIFSKKDILSINKGLAEVIIQFFPEAIQTPGIISMVSSSLSAAGIAIREIMSSAPELILIVANEDVIPVLSILKSLKERNDA